MTPTQINIDFDPISQKQESIQYVPLFSTLEVILQHEDVLSVLYAENDSNNTSIDSDRKKLRSYRDGIAHKENGLFSCDQGCHQIREIREIRENQGNLDTIRENQGKNMDLMKNQGKSGNFLIL